MSDSPHIPGGIFGDPVLRKIASLLFPSPAAIAEAHELAKRESWHLQCRALGVPAEMQARHELMVARLEECQTESRYSLQIAGWLRMISAAKRGDPIIPDDPVRWVQELCGVDLSARDIAPAGLGSLQMFAELAMVARKHWAEITA